jgi:hypothetical protein
MAHQDGSVRASDLSLLFKKAGSSATLLADGPRQEHGYRNTGRMDKLEGAE